DLTRAAEGAGARRDPWPVGGGRYPGLRVGRAHVPVCDAHRPADCRAAHGDASPGRGGSGAVAVPLSSPGAANYSCDRPDAAKPFPRRSGVPSRVCALRFRRLLIASVRAVLVPARMVLAGGGAPRRAVRGVYDACGVRRPLLPAVVVARGCAVLAWAVRSGPAAPPRVRRARSAGQPEPRNGPLGGPRSPADSLVVRRAQACSTLVTASGGDQLHRDAGDLGGHFSWAAPSIGVRASREYARPGLGLQH